MADINLTQGEADKLMAMEKRSVDEKDGFSQVRAREFRFH
jgi:hypothetical protein